MEIQKLFQTLAEPVRLRVAVLLLERELCVCDLMEVLQLPQSTISRHMARMKSAGLARDRRNGKWIYYRLSEGPLIDDLKDFLRHHCLAGEPHRSDLDALSKYVNREICS